MSHIAEMKSLYYDPRFGMFNATKLYKKLHERGVKVAMKELKQFIKSQALGQRFKHPKKVEYYKIMAPPNSYQAI
jgi:hypothetical protein